MVMGFFITRGMSIKKWHALGLLDREKLIYEFHLKNETLSKIYCFTYGVDDDKYSFLLHDNFKIIPMHKFFNSKLGIIFYSLILPFIHFRKIKKCNILKTDQMDGSWSAVLAKIFFSKTETFRSSSFTTLNKNWHFFGLFSYKSTLIGYFLSLNKIDKTIPGNPAPVPRSAQIPLFLVIKSMT